MKTYDGKTILITGASSGIGRAMARQLAAPGRTLLLVARSEDRLHDLADTLRAQGPDVAVFPRDLSRPGAAKRLFEQVTEAGYHPEVLLNNAGFGKVGRFETYDAATYDEMITVNVTNLVSLTRCFLPNMLDRGDAGVLNVASTAAYQPVPYFAVYAATKSFVLHFSEALHGEFADRDVTISCLSPGATDTGFQQRAASDPERLKSGASPERVAAVGLQALLDDKRTRVAGLTNAIGALMGRLAPRSGLLAVLRRTFAPEG